MATTLTEDSPKSKHLLDLEPATYLEAVTNAHNLTPEDIQELQGLGFESVDMALLQCISVSADAYTAKHNGVIVAWFGVQRDDKGYGRIWMLTTNDVYKCPKLLVRTAKYVIDTFGRYYHLLYNIVDPRNTQHLKFLKLLGFKRLGPVSVGPRQLTYFEFAKLCVHQPSRRLSVSGPPLLGR